MDFSLSAEQTAIFDMACDFGDDHIAPHARAWEDAGTIPPSLWKECAPLGLGGLWVDPELGGSGLSRLDATLVFQGLARACPSVAAFLSIHNMCVGMIARHATPTLRETLLPEVLQLDRILSYCLTEPGAGSDAASLTTRAVAVAGGWLLTGTKAFISGGGYSGGYIVMARSGGPGPKGISAFYIPDGAKGLSFGGLEHKMGWKAQPTRQVQMDAVFVPDDHVIGTLGQGFRYAMAGLDGGRLNIAACSLGAAEAAVAQTTAYMTERRAFGAPLKDFQALAFRLADADISLAAARVLLRQAAWSLDQGTADATRLCAMAKAFVTETAYSVVDDCLQLHGGYGYLADYGLEKRLRDLRVHRILEGTSEIMRVIVARGLWAE